MAQSNPRGYEVPDQRQCQKFSQLKNSIWTRVIDNGESEQVEFKSTLRINLHTEMKDPRIETAVLKTIAGFLNTNGGKLVIGVSDDGTPVGIEADQFPNEDKMSLHLVNIVKERMSPLALTYMHSNFEDYDSKRVLVIRCQRSPPAVFVKDGSVERFYVRTGPSTTELRASQTQEYISKRFKRMNGIYTEDTLVQQTTAEYLEQQLGWESVYAYNNEDFGPDSLLGRASDRKWC